MTEMTDTRADTTPNGSYRISARLCIIKSPVTVLFSGFSTASPLAISHRSFSQVTRISPSDASIMVFF